MLSPNTVLKDEQLGITPAPLEIKRGNGVQRWSELPDGIWLAQAIDNLTSDDGVAPLSARQGKLLKELIDAVPKTEVVNDLTTGGSGKALSAEQGKALKALIDALTTPVPGPLGPKGTLSSVTGKFMAWPTSLIEVVALLPRTRTPILHALEVLS